MLRFQNLVIVFLVFLMAGLAVVIAHNHKYLDPQWIDPHDWSRDRDPLDDLCPPRDTCKPCEKTAQSEYRRLVKTIFDPSQFRLDESTNYLYRTVHIHITKEQMDELQKSDDPMIIDGLLSKILAQTEFGTIQLVKEYVVDITANIWNHMPPLEWPFTSHSDHIFDILPRSRPIFINFAVVILTYLLCRRFRINYLVVAFFGLAYYLYEYLDDECHKRIEINQTIDLIYGNEKNPCLSPSKMNWYDWVLGRDSRSACHDFLAKQRTYKNECGVIDLFHEFFTTVAMKQLKIFFTSIAEMVHSISTTNGILITAVTLYFMKDLLVTIIQSMFKYILNPTIWSRVAADINSQTDEPMTPNSAQRADSPFDTDIRDVNVSKALDLANQQMKLILEHKHNALSQMQPSGIEMLAVKESTENASKSDLSLATSSGIADPISELSDSSKCEVLPVSSGAETASQMSPSLTGSTHSFEAFQLDDIVLSAKVQDSLISLPSTETDSLQTSVSIGDSQSSENPSIYSATISSTNSNNKSADELSDGATSSDSDSVEILSISSGTASS